MTNREEAIRLAREAKGVVTKYSTAPHYCCAFTLEDLERLIQLAKNEAFREAAAVISSKSKLHVDHNNYPTQTGHVLEDCEAAILSLIQE